MNKPSTKKTKTTNRHNSGSAASGVFLFGRDLKQAWGDLEKQVRPFLPAVSLGWLITWAAIYLCIILVGLFFPFSPVLTTVKLVGIFLCLVFAVVNFRDDALLLAALFFTVCADVLLANNNLSTSGVMVFAMAQLAHFVRLGQNGRYTKYYFYGAILILAASILMPPEHKIVVYGAVYALTLLSNLALSFRWAQAEPGFHSLAALAGFALFLACDVHVLTSYLTVIGVLPIELKAYADYMAWIFYYPSQLCVAASSKRFAAKIKSPAKISAKKKAAEKN